MVIGLIFPPLRICSDISQQEEGFVILLPTQYQRLKLQSQTSWGQTNLRKIFLKLKN